MTVRAYHGAIETNVSCLERGNAAKLCGEEVRLRNTVFFVQYIHYIELDSVRNVFSERARAGKEVELFAVYTLRKRLSHLVAGKVREKVVDIEYGVVFVLAYADVNRRSVGFCDRAVKSKRNCCPLIFLYSAVVMGFEKAHSVGFVKRALLQVHSRRVDVRRGKTDALAEALRADDKRRKGFIVVIVIILFSGGNLRAEFVRNKALFFKHRDSFLYAFALRFAAVEKLLVIVAISICVCYDVFGKRLESVLLRIEQLLFELLCLCFFFCHDILSFQKLFSKIKFVCFVRTVKLK